MSVTDKREVKILLPRTGSYDLWRRLIEDAGDDDRRLERLAMLALREQADWPIEEIARVFGHHKGHISREIIRVKDELRAHYGVAEQPAREAA